MATPNEYLKTAASYIGIGGTDNIFNTWIWGFHCYDPNEYPWCAAFQSYVGVHDLDMPFKPSASAAGVGWQGTPVDDSNVQPGDWVLFTWDGRQDFGWADHIGVVEWSDINDSGYFGTIEGNTGGGEGVVARCTRYNWGSYGTKFFRPPYTKKDPKLSELIVWPTNGDKNQRFTLEENGEYYLIRCNSNNKVIDVCGSELGADVCLYEAHGGDNQLWRIMPIDDFGMYEIQSKLDIHYVLDAKGNSSKDGEGLCCWKRNGQPNQRWHLMKNDDGSFTIVSNMRRKLVLDCKGGQ